MRRRNFLSVLGGAAAWPVAARAQQGERMRRLGILFGGFAADDPEPQARMAAFRQTLQQFGWVDGRNIRIDYRIGGPEAERVRRHALDLISLTPDLIVANSNAALVAVQKETRAIPIVFVNVADPVATGSVVSLANPGGNITGFSNFEGSMGGKWLELLKEIAPSITRVAVAHDTASPIVVFRKSIESAGSSFSLQLTFVSVHNFAEIEAIIAEFGRDTGGALVFPGGSVAAANRKLLTQLTAQHHLPTIYGFGYFPRMGGLMSYGVDGVEQWRRASSYVDRILRGAKPSDLPVQLPTKFELIINLKAANALGLDVPPTLLARADEVIE